MELTEPELRAIVGPVSWSHDSWRCNCHEGAPNDPEAYMSSECQQNYFRGVKLRGDRIKALQAWESRVRWDSAVKTARRLRGEMVEE